MRERILVLLRPRESRGSSGFFLLPFVTVMSQLYIACSFSSPGRQRCRDGCYGETLPSFCSASSNSMPDFRSSHTILVVRRVPRFLLLLPSSPTCLPGLSHDVETSSIRQRDRFFTSKKTLLRFIPVPYLPR